MSEGIPRDVLEKVLEEEAGTISFRLSDRVAPEDRPDPEVMVDEEFGKSRVTFLLERDGDAIFRAQQKNGATREAKVDARPFRECRELRFSLGWGADEMEVSLVGHEPEVPSATGKSG